MDTDNAINPGQVTVVTVTYGDRRHLLEQVLRATLAQEVGKIIVVNNGASWNMDALASTTESKVIVLNMDTNVGSAGGFSAGIARAMETDCELIWLLDDDNLPNADCLKELLHATNLINSEKFVALAARPRFIGSLTTSAKNESFTKKVNYFLEFHVLDIPIKIKKLFSRTRPTKVNTHCRDISLSIAPYGGMLFHKSLVHDIGFPKADLCLYADDSEYAWRMVHRGYSIRLICSAIVDDLDDWEDIFHRKFGIIAWLDAPIYRIYYGMRNHIWFAYYKVCTNRKLFLLNGFIFLTILISIGVFKLKYREIIAIYDAAHDGLFSKLGESHKYPLPGKNK